MKKRIVAAVMALAVCATAMPVNCAYAAPSVQEMMVDNLISKLGGAEVVDKQYVAASDTYCLTLKSDANCEGQVELYSANVLIDFDGHYIYGDGLNISNANVTMTDGGGIISEDRTESADHEAIFARGSKLNFIVDKTTPHQPNANIPKGVSELKAMGNAHAIQCTTMTGGTTDIYAENVYLYSKEQSGLLFDGGNIEIDNIIVETDYRSGMHIMLRDENQTAVIHNANVKTDLDCTNPYAPPALDVANFNGIPHLGKVIVNGGTFQGGYEGVVNVNGNLEINGGTFIGGDDGLAAMSDGQTNINGGTFKGGVCGAVAYEAPLNVKGGTFIGTGAEGRGIAVWKGTLDVSPSSTVSTNGDVGIGEYPLVPAEGNSSVVVKGGNITGKVNGINLHNADVEIYGGNIKGQSGHSMVLTGLAGAKAAIYDADVNTVELVSPSAYDSLLASNIFIAKGKFVTTEQGGFAKYDKNNGVWRRNAKSLTEVKLTSVNASNEGMKINWEKNSSATEYLVYRVDKDKTALIGTTSGTSFVDKGANTNGEKYTYYVMATNSNGMSSKVTSKSGYFFSAPVMSSVEKTSKGIAINWKRNAKVDGYYVYRSMNGGSYKKIATIAKNSTVKYTDSKAKTNGAKYQYKVLAYSSKGNSDYSSVKTTYYLSRPSLSKISNVQGKKLALAWKRNTKASGYQVKYVTGNTSKTVTIKKNKIVKYTISKLKKKTYKVYIRSYKTVSGKKYYSAWSPAKSKKITK